MASALVSQMYNDIRDYYGGNVVDYFEEEYYTGVGDTPCIATACEISFPNGGAANSPELEVVFQSSSFQSGEILGVAILVWSQYDGGYENSESGIDDINVLEVAGGRVKCTIKNILNQYWFSRYHPVLLVLLTETDNAQSQAGEARVLSPAGVSVVTSFDPLPSTQKLQTPTGLYADNITSDSARISWTAVENASGYKVEYRRQGDTTWNE